jgi:hypothetical protein
MSSSGIYVQDTFRKCVPDLAKWYLRVKSEMSSESTSPAFVPFL